MAARSPDITLLDFFLWETLKNIVYQEVPTTPKNMKQRIIATYATISPQVLRSVRASGIERLQCCINANGHHFEHTFDIRNIVLFLHLMTNDLLL